MMLNSDLKLTTSPKGEVLGIPWMSVDVTGGIPWSLQGTITDGAEEEPRRGFEINTLIQTW